MILVVFHIFQTVESIDTELVYISFNKVKRKWCVCLNSLAFNNFITKNPQCITKSNTELQLTYLSTSIAFWPLQIIDQA